jgi:hypothetical protein
MPLKTADGQELSPDEIAAANQDFARMMAKPEPIVIDGAEPDYPAPPKKDPEAPQPSRRGRPPKDAHDKPRTAPKASAKPTGPPKDYTGALADTATGVWVSLSAMPVTRAYAAVWKQNIPQQVSAWNQAANQNSTVRTYAEKLASGEGGVWVLGVAMAAAPLAAGFWQVFKATPDQRAQVAEHNDQEFQAWVKVNIPGLLPEDEETT